jgi:hypothetical protein
MTMSITMYRISLEVSVNEIYECQEKQQILMTMNITMYRISLGVRVFHVTRTLLSIVVN